MFRHLSGLEMIIEQSLAVGGVHVLPVLLLGHVSLHPVQILAEKYQQCVPDLNSLTFSIEEAQSCT